MRLAVKARVQPLLGYAAKMPKNKPLKELLGENVRAVMKARRVSQPKVAAIAKKRGTPIDQTTVGRIARAEFPATMDTLEAMANGLGLEPWQLLLPELKVEQIVFSDKDREQVEQARKVLEGLTAAQRDMFLQEGLVKDLLSRPPFPAERMGAGWDASGKRKK